MNKPLYRRVALLERVGFSKVQALVLGVLLGNGSYTVDLENIEKLEEALDKWFDKEEQK